VDGRSTPWRNAWELLNSDVAVRLQGAAIMTWNHRVVKYETKNLFGDPDVGFAIHEVYYDQDGNVRGMTANAVKPWGDTKDELRLELLRMLEALNKPDIDLNEQEDDWRFANEA
jgi:hypothetical protein